MPSEVGWLVEKRVIFIREYGHVTLEDLQSGAEIVMALLAQAGEEPIHFLSDQSEMLSTVMNFGDLRRVLKTLRHPAVGWLVIYREHHNPLLAFIMRTVAQMFGVRQREFSSREAAIDFLVKADPSLEPLLPTVTHAGG